MRPELDPGSATWRFVEAHAQQQIAALREKNDSVALDAVQTAVLRGRIAELKTLLALAKAPAQPSDDGGHYGD